MAKTKKSNKSKVRGYIFSENGNVQLVVVARTKEEAETRYVKHGGAEGCEPDVAKVGFAY